MNVKDFRDFLKNIKKYGFNNLLIRNVIRIMVIVLLPVAIVLLWVLYYGSSILDDSLEKANLRTLNRAQVMMDMFITETISIGERLNSNKDVIKLVNRLHNEYPNYEEIELRVSVADLLEYNKTEYIESIYIYSALNNYIFSANEGGDPALFTETSWLNAYLSGTIGENHDYFSLILDNGDNTQICYFRPLRTTYTESAGVIAIMLRQSVLDRLMLNINDESAQDILFIDHNGYVVYSVNRELINNPIWDFLPGLSYEGIVSEDRQTIKDSSGNIFICNVLSSTVNDWRYVSVISGNEFLKGRGAFYTAILILFILCLVLAFICTLFISSEAYKPVAVIREMLDDPMSVNPEKLQKDELRYILGSLFKSSDTDVLNNEEIKNRMGLLNKARISALQAQINPHFLYNTLQAIVFVFIKETGNADARSVELIEQLSSLIRETTHMTKALVTLKEEAGYIEKYVCLQKARFGDMLNYSIILPDDTLDLFVPKMSLQPLVENAFIHGDSFKSGYGSIEISAETDGETLKIIVSDNGGGMTQNRIDEINSALTSEIIFQDTHIGLNNVNSRLRLIFGNNAGLKLAAAPEGLSVIMTLPVKDDL